MLARVSIGGVRSISDLLHPSGRVESHDFVGCMRGVMIDTVQMFTQQTVSKYNVTDHCTMTARSSLCSNTPCQNNGQCVPEHFSYRCQCIGEFMGVKCEKGYRNNIKYAGLTRHIQCSVD